MNKLLFTILVTTVSLHLTAQNLVTNPGAEALPRGTGWTIVSQGTYPCTPIPTNTFLNWTLIPDGTVNYPFDHTTGNAGGTIFYAGCSDFGSGIKELHQVIDVTADAAAIDAGTQLYTFSGYMQTPVDNQTDRGRFIVDYLTSSDVVLGTSYISNWQSYFGGSGTAWNFYTNTRLAPTNTRKIRIRLQAELIINRYAINVYFDDISLTKPSLVPVRIISFTGAGADAIVHIKWNTASETNLDHYELERSHDAVSYQKIAAISGGRNVYEFKDNINGIEVDKFFYRLKTIDLDGRISYSEILVVTNRMQTISVSPNPANEWIRVSGTNKTGLIHISNATGRTILTSSTTAQVTNIDISKVPPGIYFVRYVDGTANHVKKLVIQ